MFKSNKISFNYNFWRNFCVHIFIFVQTSKDQIEISLNISSIETFTTYVFILDTLVSLRAVHLNTCLRAENTLWPEAPGALRS